MAPLRFRVSQDYKSPDSKPLVDKILLKLFSYFKESGEFGEIMQTMSYCMHEEYVDTLTVF
jgi:hypothetical protein